MSTLHCDVCEVSNVREHPNADRLEVAEVKGWQVVTGKGCHTNGDLVVHVPPDALVPRPRAEEWGVDQHLSWQARYAEKDLGRVRVARLRGEMSYGFLVSAPGGASVGSDFADEWGIEKWEPPVELTSGDQEVDHPMFHRYTHIENWRNWPGMFPDPDEYVVATEKLHGTNCRVGLLVEDGEETWFCGSHNTRKKLDCGSLYELPLRGDLGEKVRDLLRAYLGGNNGCAVLFGEVYGGRVQDLRYGKTDPEFAAFDLTVNGEYVDGSYLFCRCLVRGIPTVPMLYHGAFCGLDVHALASGNTTIEGGDHVREGIVVKPIHERRDPALGRVILKVINDDYLLRKGGSENH